MSAKDDEYYLRRRAYELRLEGKTIKLVSKTLGKSDAFVKKWFKRGLAGKGFHDRPRAGAPRKVKPEMEKTLRKEIKKVKKGGSKAAAKKIINKYNIKISSKTVRRTAKRMGIKYRIRKKKPRLNAKDIKDRLRFARKRRPKGFWKKVWLTDEKAFIFHMEPRGQWIEMRDELKPIEKDLVEKTVRVWAGVSGYGKTNIYRIKPMWNKTDYEIFLKQKAIPDISEKSPNGYVFEHDGDGSHRGKNVLKYFKDNSIQLLDDLPAHSPDIPIIENMWKLTGDGVRNRNFKTIDGLWKVIKEEWENISDEKVENLVKSIPRRLLKIRAGSSDFGFRFP
jgi:transposase